MRIVWPPADAVCSLAARIDCLISSAVLPVSALACSALTNSTSAAQLSHQIRVSDPHWRMIHTRSRSMVMRVVLLPVISYLSSPTCHLLPVISYLSWSLFHGCVTVPSLCHCSIVVSLFHRCVTVPSLCHCSMAASPFH